MSVDLNPSEEAASRERDPKSLERGRGVRIDERITAIVPGFDAPFFQAGLAGYSDGAMRLIARRHGCPYCVSEALLDLTLINGGKGRTREDPDLLAAECGTGDPGDNVAAGIDDHPIAGQIMGTEPDTMAKGAAILVAMNHDVIDVNFACPVKKIKKANRGGHFLTAPDQAVEVLKAVREAVPEHIPTTVKLRRAWDDTPAMARNFERVFSAAYELGYAWATVHCRTVQQRYKGPARWSFLTDLVQRHPEKIIMGSGDVWTVHDIFAMLETTGVHAVAVARGCIGNPWIFRQARQVMAGQHPTKPSIQEQRQVLLEHCELAARLHGDRVAARTMRKFGIKFAAHHPHPETVKSRFIRCKSMAEWRAVLDAYYAGEAELGAQSGDLAQAS